MARAKGKVKRLEASLIGIPDIDYGEKVTIPFDLEDVGKLQIGQEVKIVITGCVKRLEGDDHYSAIGIEVYDKSVKKTANAQAAAIQDLADESDGEDY